MLGQVLQVPSGSHQQLQGVTTAQLIQPGELTEEQHQQVHLPKHIQTHCLVKKSKVFFIGISKTQHWSTQLSTS